MTIKNATLIALILVALGTLFSVALQLLHVYSQGLYLLAGLLTPIGLIIFLATLYSKQN